MSQSYECKHPVVVPRRGTLKSNPSLNAVQTGDSRATIYPCLGEVHAPQDMLHPTLNTLHLCSAGSLHKSFSDSAVSNRRMGWIDSAVGDRRIAT